MYNRHFLWIINFLVMGKQFASRIISTYSPNVLFKHKRLIALSRARALLCVV